MRLGIIWWPQSWRWGAILWVLPLGIQPGSCGKDPEKIPSCPWQREETSNHCETYPEPSPSQRPTLWGEKQKKSLPAPNPRQGNGIPLTLAPFFLSHLTGKMESAGLGFKEMDWEHCN